MRGTGVFTQEDPIGLAGGLNLYGFADGDPINFSDPFGLSACDPPDDPNCQTVAEAKVGFTLGLRYGVKVGRLEGEASIGATAEVGVTQEGSVLDGGDFTNRGTAGARVGAGLKVKAFGVGVDEFVGRQAGDAREGIRTTPAEGDGTTRITATIPTLWAGPVPVGGPQVTFSLNVPAALRRIFR